MASVDMENVNSLLMAVKPKVDEMKKEEANRCSREESFNIFTIMGIQEREVYICKIIGELLSPEGSHHLGSIFLEMFLNDVLNEKHLISQAKSAIVQCEDSTANGRRIDFTISIGDKIIPIEAKINAGDQESQLADYFKEIEQRVGRCDYICYITKDGRNPSIVSMTGRQGNKLGFDKVKKISWKESIIPWLNKISKLDELKNDTHKQLLSDITQLIYTIQGWYSPMGLQFSDCINESNIDSAIAIWHCMELKRYSIREKFNKLFSKYAKERGIEIISEKNDFECYFLKDIKVAGKKLDISLYFGERIGFRIYQGGEIKEYKKIGLTLNDFKNSDIFPDNVDLTPVYDSCIHELPYPTLDKEKNESISFSNPAKALSTMKLLLDNNMNDYVNSRVIPLIEQLTGWGKGVISCAKETQGC